MFKVSAVPPRRSAVLTVFRGATGINDGTTAEPRRSWRCHCGLCRTGTAVAPRLRCDGTSTVEARRNMFKVSAVPPRAKVRGFEFSAVLRRSMTEPLRNHSDHGGATAIYAVQAPQWHRASGKWHTYYTYEMPPVLGLRLRCWRGLSRRMRGTYEMTAYWYIY